MFLKECKYIEKKIIKHINENLSDFSSFDESDQEYNFFDKYLKSDSHLPKKLSLFTSSKAL